MHRSNLWVCMFHHAPSLKGPTHATHACPQCGGWSATNLGFTHCFKTFVHIRERCAIDSPWVGSWQPQQGDALHGPPIKLIKTLNTHTTRAAGSDGMQQEGAVSTHQGSGVTSLQEGCHSPPGIPGDTCDGWDAGIVAGCAWFLTITPHLEDKKNMAFSYCCGELCPAHPGWELRGPAGCRNCRPIGRALQRVAAGFASCRQGTALLGITITPSLHGRRLRPRKFRCSQQTGRCWLQEPPARRRPAHGWHRLSASLFPQLLAP